MRIRFRNIRSFIRPAAVVTVASISLITYSLLTPPLLEQQVFSRIPFFSGFPEDFGIYLFRFFLSFVLLGLIPIVTAVTCGENLRSIGFSLPAGYLRSRQFLVLFLFFIVLGITGAFLPGLYKFYPFSRTLVQFIRFRHPLYLLLHYVLYIVLYYVPWELFFRGYLIFPVLRLLHPSVCPRQTTGKSPDTRIPFTPLTFCVASFPILPSLLLHIGHPVSELSSVVIGGFVFGCLAISTGSIIPSLILHSTAGIILDTVVIIRTIGSLQP